MANFKTLQKLFSTPINIEYYEEDISEEEIDEHIDIATNAYDNGDYTIGYESAMKLSEVAINKKEKDRFKKVAQFYLNA